jgi:chaperonin GroES
MGTGHEGGEISVAPGEWKPMDYPGDDIRKALMPMPYKEPSLVLFQLLGTMIDACEKMGAVTDVLSGEQPGANVPAATVLALIEQGLKVFSSIYKRIYLALKQEFKKLYILNGIYMEDQEYYMVLDDTKAVAKADYNFTDCNIMPVSSDADVADIQRIVKAQALMELRGQGYNDRAITDRYLEALNIPNVDEIKNAPAPQGPDPKLLIEQAKLEIQVKELALDAARFELEKQRTVQEGMKAFSQAMKNLADAEAAEKGTQIEFYKSQLKAITDMVKAQVSMNIKESGNGGSRGSNIAGMEGIAGNQGGALLSGAGAGETSGGVGPGENPELGAGGPLGPENSMGGGAGGNAEENLGV